MTFRHNFIYFDKITSTNTLAEQFLRSEKLPEGTVIYAGEQTDGAGLGDNKWLSNPGMNLTASVILYPSFLPVEDQFALTKLLSVSVCRLIETLDPGLKSEIKWPNDIYVNRRKIAGLLIRNSISGKTISNTVAGLGLNVNQITFGKNAPMAISLSQITGETYDIKHLLTKWHDLLMKSYAELKQEGQEQLNSQYLSKLYLLNKEAQFMINGETLRAVIQGIGLFGKLRLKALDGREFICDLKEVAFISDESKL
ncbi:MAG: biotin--[acetyl-CoA-carboxylase] ligase [Lentimicrobium sp.]|nr:biotin--[acetyl-CoA-carboxylase] ligase [Lentimicrobium sp.]